VIKDNEFMDDAIELVIGTKAWSTWSLRPWLVLARSGAAFTETLIQLRQEDNMTRAAILPHSPSGLVPALKTDGLVIVDFLAICEFLHERFPKVGLWPKIPPRGPWGVPQQPRCIPALAL